MNPESVIKLAFLRLNQMTEERKFMYFPLPGWRVPYYGVHHNLDIHRMNYEYCNISIKRIETGYWTG